MITLVIQVILSFLQPPPTPPSRRQPGVIDYQNSRISSRVTTFQRNSFQKHQEDDIHRKSSGSNNITSIKIQQQEKNSGKYLSARLRAEIITLKYDHKI